MNKTYSGLVSSPVNQKELNISYSNTYTFGGTVVESIPQLFKPAQQDEPVTPVEPEPQPEQVHLFEVYANQECTERPQVGQSYERLYVKVNADLSLGYSYNYQSSDFCTLNVWLDSEDPINVQLYVDFASEELSLPIAGDVIECNLNEQAGVVTITEPLQVSFGPVAPFVHQVEIFADEECTERPVTGQNYQLLYASLHGVAENESMNEGESPNTFVIYQGNSIVLTYAGYWAKTIYRNSEYILNQVHQLQVNYPSDELTADVFSFGKIVADE